MLAVRLRLALTIVTLVLTSAGVVHAAPKLNLTYTGFGVARFVEKYSRYGSGTCAVITHTSEEGVADVNWLSKWEKVNPAIVSNPKPTVSVLLGSNSRRDSDDCGAPEFICVSALDLYEGIPGSMLISKSGKNGYILTLFGEQQTRGLFSNSEACKHSSVFDNAITEGMNGNHITAIKVKITPAKKKKTITLPYELIRNYDCTDPAKTAAFISSTCTIETGFQGLITISGKWKIKLVE